jgi:hypothetical protein
VRGTPDRTTVRANNSTSAEERAPPVITMHLDNGNAPRRSYGGDTRTIHGGIPNHIWR